ncbi:MAG TPA: cytochrome c oxidase subunit 3 [Azospirillaceae bacterium]|nr:cytochrome c oxidase subunit 3 [Azospirillaceae bacterium]
MAAETHATTAHAHATDAPGVPHPYHLVNPSPWPILGAFAGGLLATGLVLFMHNMGTIVLYAGLASVLAVMFGWWRDVLNESVKEKAHTPVVKIGLRYGMALFIASEVMFFVAFFWAYFDAALFPREAIGGVWPPANIQTVDPFDLPLMLTLILLLSGTTVTAAHHAIIEGDIKLAGRMLGYTVGLGVLFTGFQIYEYAHAHFGFTEGIYASTFYMATGFHGFHVFVGTVFLAVCWYRTVRGHFTSSSHFGFEAAAWYWHFVDVVWLFLFVAVYWYGSGGGH